MNILSDFLNAEKSCEKFDTLFENGSVKVKRISSNEFKNGDWYYQESDEFVYLIDGEATLEFENNEFKELKKCDFILIQKRVRHRVYSTSSDAIWLVIFF